MKAKWRIKTDRAVDDAKTKEERQAEARLSTAEAELTAEAERQPATAEAERRAQAEQVSAAAQSVGQTDRHPGAVGGGEGAGWNMGDEFAELFAQQRAVQTERHTGAGEDEGGEAANDDRKGEKDEKQADEEEEGKGGKYGRPWMWAAAATIVVGLFLGPSLMPVLDGVKSKFKPKEALTVQQEVLYVGIDMANIRGEASSNSRIIARVAYNSKVTGIKRKGSWVRVITDGAKKPVGWIHSSLLRPQNPRQ